MFESTCESTGLTRLIILFNSGTAAGQRVCKYTHVSLQSMTINGVVFDNGKGQNGTQDKRLYLYDTSHTICDVHIYNIQS